MTTIKNKLSINYHIYDENVHYKEIEPESINIYDNNLPSIEIVLSNIIKYYKQFFFQKHFDYKDENEFRIVLLQKEKNIISNNLLVEISNSLKLIILGDRFPEVYLPTIKGLSTKLDIEYRKLHWEQNQYFLLKEEV